ncbi:hypothetical protein ACMAUO_09740 [Gluconacetobacter sp. Hr-1-5]|uniref:hypothetical protein n=1 Tax=Gluconacetobacter sp. Hr-1-5 TaxID=3395370 RepID=UPI003B525FCE
MDDAVDRSRLVPAGTGGKLKQITLYFKVIFYENRVVCSRRIVVLFRLIEPRALPIMTLATAVAEPRRPVHVYDAQDAGFPPRVEITFRVNGAHP